MDNPPNPWLSEHVDWEGEPPPAKLHVYEERAKSALSKNDSPDIPFRFSLNPYRGCYHGCIYCYARPSHQYLGWGAGTDFERRIVVKTNIADLLRTELGRRSWRGEEIAFSGNTDCYQPLEASLGLTRSCLEVCLEHRQPVGIVTKGLVIRRDVALLAELASAAHVMVFVSIPFLDDDLGRQVEPWASPISRRFETLRVLSAAGVPTGLAIAPLIPGLNDADVPGLLRRARDAGAQTAFMTPIRLSRHVRPVFDGRLSDALPGRATKVQNGIREMRGGKKNETAFGSRMTGQGERWRAIEQLFVSHRRRLGLSPRPKPSASTFVRPAQPEPTRQLSLFD